jgi:hypothetical protein
MIAGTVSPAPSIAGTPVPDAEPPAPPTAEPPVPGTGSVGCMGVVEQAVRVTDASANAAKIAFVSLIRTSGLAVI